MDNKIRLGISTCLLGEKVRYDGGHKLDRFLTETLGQYVEYLPVCPEVECGLPVPREPLRQVGDSRFPRLIVTRTGLDLTERMTGWAGKRVRELEREDLCGFIFKANSPSSGMERVRVYDAGGVARKTGVGLFARAFMERFPLLPVEDEGRLHDPRLRESFIERIFVFKRWREMMVRGRSLSGLVGFHTTHKLLILSHSPALYREMGRLVADPKELPLRELFDRYLRMLMEALGRQATASKHVNVLHHMMGYFKRELSGDEKQELLEVIEQYRAGLVPLVVPVTLFNHYVRKYDQPYLREQHYLRPHPIELRLRNHV
ncbi:MAG: DUF523 and DUF1722 domain-containing protein [bacterium]